MKWIEDILRAKLGSSNADANPSMDEELWNNIQAGLTQPANESGSAPGNSTGLNRTAFGVAALFVVVGIGVGSTLFVGGGFGRGCWRRSSKGGGEVGGGEVLLPH